jgi:hypothetical protein
MSDNSTGNVPENGDTGIKTHGNNLPYYTKHDKDSDEKGSDANQVNRFIRPMDKLADKTEENQKKAKFDYKKDIKYDNELHAVEAIEYKNTKELFPDAEYDMYIIHATKHNAIKASQEYMLSPDYEEKRENFMETQYKLRYLLGKYVSKYIKDESMCAPFGFRYEKNHLTDMNRGYLVEFTCTENKKNAIPTPILARVDQETANFDLFNISEHPHLEIQAKNIMLVINSAKQRTMHLYANNCTERDKRQLEMILEQIDADVKSLGDQQHSFSKPINGKRGLGSNAEHWDDTARHASAHLEERKFDIFFGDENEPPLHGTYRFGQNIIIPTKRKFEHSFKTIHRFSLDFSEILLPMHFDLIVKIDSREYVWTISAFQQNRHQIIHAGYFSDDERLFENNESIDQMTTSNQGKEYYEKFYERASIEAPSLERNDEQSILNLHTFMARSKLKSIYKDTMSTCTEDHYTNVCYIYKYNTYTIVASGIKAKNLETWQEITPNQYHRNYTNLVFQRQFAFYEMQQYILQMFDTFLYLSL